MNFIPENPNLYYSFNSRVGVKPHENEEDYGEYVWTDLGSIG